jgi:hypothetical protein
MALEHEFAVYQAHLMELLPHQGKFIIIKGDDIAGPVDTYEEALEVGFGRFGAVPFLVKQIHAVEPVLHFTRDLPPCRP